MITHSGGGGQDRGRMHPDTGSPHSFLFSLSLSFPVRASHCGKLACICRRGNLRSTSVTFRVHVSSVKRQNLKIPVVREHPQPSAHQRLGVRLRAGLMRASTADVRDPAAEMTSCLPSCRPVPTVCARKSAADVDIYIQHTCQWGCCVRGCFLHAAGVPTKPQRGRWQTGQLKQASDPNFTDSHSTVFLNSSCKMNIQSFVELILDIFPFSGSISAVSDQATWSHRGWIHSTGPPSLLGNGILLESAAKWSNIDKHRCRQK